MPSMDGIYISALCKMSYISDKLTLKDVKEIMQSDKGFYNLQTRRNTKIGYPNYYERTYSYDSYVTV